MDKDLIQKLKWCKRELAALKIAHVLSIDDAVFYSASGTEQFLFSPSELLEVTVEYDSNIEYQPFCQVYISCPQFFNDYFLNYYTYVSKAHVFDAYINRGAIGNTIFVTVKAISTADIKSFKIEKKGI